MELWTSYNSFGCKEGKKTNAECLPSIECREISLLFKSFTKTFNCDFQADQTPLPLKRLKSSIDIIYVSESPEICAK